MEEQTATHAEYHVLAVLLYINLRSLV